MAPPSASITGALRRLASGWAAGSGSTARGLGQGQLHLELRPPTSPEDAQTSRIPFPFAPGTGRDAASFRRRSFAQHILTGRSEGRPGEAPAQKPQSRPSLHRAALCWYQYQCASRMAWAGFCNPFPLSSCSGESAGVSQLPANPPVRPAHVGLELLVAPRVAAALWVSGGDGL